MNHPESVCGVSAHSGGSWATDNYGQISRSTENVVISDAWKNLKELPKKSLPPQAASKAPRSTQGNQADAEKVPADL